MIRTILGVVIGYVVMFIVVFATLTASYMALGVDRTFAPGSFLLSPLWLVIQFFFTLIGGIVAGKVCRIVSGRGWPLIPLVVLTLILGFASAIPALLAVDSVPVRTADISMWQAILNGKAPKWFTVLMPLVSVFGEVLGGRRKK
jgi:hypothetical protein